ncbi:MAG: C2H2-type zinc finger protein [Candidatus Aenigmatarchaeota archaeon]
MAVKLRCNICGFESDDAVVFCSHILSMHSKVGETQAVEEAQEGMKESLLECVICDAKFATNEELEKHYKEAHPEEYKQAVEYVKKTYLIDIEDEGEGNGANGNSGESEKSKGKSRKRAKRNEVSLDTENIL